MLSSYVPLSSGVTIATGVDLGQQNESGLRRLRVSEAIINKLKPYLGLRGSSAKAKLATDPLVLSYQEGLALNSAFKDDLLKRINPYSEFLSIRGKAVLASLSHW